MKWDGDVLLCSPEQVNTLDSLNPPTVSTFTSNSDPIATFVSSQSV